MKTRLKDLIKAAPKSELTKEQIKLIDKEYRRTKGLYPLVYKKRYWFEKDCGDVFTSFYHCKEALVGGNLVYMTEGIWLSPDDESQEN